MSFFVLVSLLGFSLLPVLTFSFKPFFGRVFLFWHPFFRKGFDFLGSILSQPVPVPGRDKIIPKKPKAHNNKKEKQRNQKEKKHNQQRKKKEDRNRKAREMKTNQKEKRTRKGKKGNPEISKLSKI